MTATPSIHTLFLEWLAAGRPAHIERALVDRLCWDPDRWREADNYEFRAERKTESRWAIAFRKRTV